MLNLINNSFLLISIFLYMILFTRISGEYLLINLMSIVTIISYYSLLYINVNINVKYYRKKYLTIQVFFYTLLFICFNNLISYYYDNNFWVFNEVDALFYHNEVLKVLYLPIDKAIDSYLGHMGTDDLGMILILYPLYHIVVSTLILNLFYLFVGLITALSIFNISSHFMTKKYAYLASVAYSLSSFTIYFHSIGLKESFMVMLVVLSFDFYYRFIKSKNIMNLLVAFLFIAPILLFRPAISAIMLFAIVLGSMNSKRGGVGIKIIAFIGIIILFLNVNILIGIINRYIHGGFEWFINSKEEEGMIIGGVPFTYAVNILGQAIGPLPTLVSSEKISLTFYGAGLIYRVLLAFPFWLGIIYIFKTKSYKVYPLIFFVLMEMSALFLLLEGLELRKSLPHIPIVFIIAFWFLDKYDNKLILIKRKKRFKQFFKFSMFLLAIIILFWNFK